MIFKLSYLNSNLALTLGYLNPALNNSALGIVVQKVDGAIQWITQFISHTIIRWIVIYPVDSGTIQHLNTWRCPFFY